ncbi:uncharacterized protein J3D65DRAFT_666697 [Phyllosticta citribraziliensis]|uniref:Uncharacterized protein n=1 Tax=Phyllosticta citribraziliensis TaxID=989973 RepID=A0ABR1LXX3_9PEZI
MAEQPHPHPRVTRSRAAQGLPSPRRGYSRATQTLAPPPPPPPPPLNQTAQTMMHVLLGALASALIFVVISRSFSGPLCQTTQTTQREPPEPCPLVPTGTTFSWIEYIPRTSYGAAAKKDSICPAWDVFNASDMAVSWERPLLPTEDEARDCHRHISWSYRKLRALWHSDRAEPPTATSIGALRRLLNLSRPQLDLIAHTLEQAYQDASFCCMTSTEKSTWLNTMTDKQPSLWDVGEMDDVTNDLEGVAADPSDLGLDLAPSEYAHVQHCMERKGTSWAHELHRMRQQRRTLWHQCKTYVESFVDVHIRKSTKEHKPTQRARMRQSVLNHFMKRTGALDGCRDGVLRPWWEMEDEPAKCMAKIHGKNTNVG